MDKPAIRHRGRLHLMGWLLAIAMFHTATARAAVAAVPDTLQQRIAACTACHGEQGEGSVKSGFFPRLAGKPVAYLVRQMQNFQNGLRKYAPMEYTVRQLSPAYMQEIARYFAAQQVPYRRSPIPAVSATTLQRGEQLAQQGDPVRRIPACASCHGLRLTGEQPSIPGLIGLPYDYISSQLGAWRSGTRSAPAPDCMAEIAHRLRASDISAVAAWLASRARSTDMHAEPAGSMSPPMQCGVLNPGEGA